MFSVIQGDLPYARPCSKSLFLVRTVEHVGFLPEEESAVTDALNLVARILSLLARHPTGILSGILDLVSLDSGQLEEALVFSLVTLSDIIPFHSE